MLLEDLITQAEQQSGQRFQFDEESLVSYANELQKLLFAKDLDAFKEYAYLQVYHTLTLSDTAYTAAVAGDIGKVVEGADSGATGILKHYNNSTREWQVYVTSGEFTDAEAITIQTGTGAGTLDESEVFRGPYLITDITDEEDAIPARKVIGITSVTDEEIYGTSLADDEGDYGLRPIKDIQTDFYEPGRINILRKSFTFSYDPDTTEDYYRWEYYRAAESIESIEDDDLVLIPEELHMAVLYDGVIAIADKRLYESEEADMVIARVCNTFWDAMGDSHIDFGEDNHRGLPGW